MLRKILVPLDGSEMAERALVYAVPLASHTGASVLVLRAAMSHTLPGVDPRERQAGALDEANTYVDEVVSRVRARDVACEGVVRYGHPAECIVESARTREVDLIVMASHGRTGPGRWMFGSVAEAVVTSSLVPVLVQRAWQPLLGTTLLDDRPVILVPLDGSPFAEAVLEPAAAFAEDLRGRLALMSAQDNPGRIREASEYLTGIKARIAAGHPDLPIACEVRDGEPVEAIEAAVAQLDVALLFMATHGRTGAARSVLGSVAGQVLQESDVPAVLLRPRQPEAEDDDAATEVGVAAVR